MALVLSVEDPIYEICQNGTSKNFFTIHFHGFAAKEHSWDPESNPTREADEKTLGEPY